VVEDSAGAAVERGSGGVGWGADRVAAHRPRPDEGGGGAAAGAVIDGRQAPAWPGRWMTRSGGAPHGGGWAAAGASTGTRRPSGGASALAA
jgi:hypothetical protein